MLTSDCASDITKRVAQLASRISSSRYLLIGSIIAGIVGTCLFLLARLYTSLDDAFITFQYAKNIALGLGFVFTRGADPVLGTTTPLFTLMLAAFGRIGFDIPLAATIIGALAHGAAVVFIYLLGKAWRKPLIGLGAASLYAVSMPVISTSGMETPLYTLFIIATFYFYASKENILAWVFAALCIMVRVDGAFVAFSLFCSYILQRRRLPIKESIIVLLLIIPWYLYSIYRFGNILPNSFYAKTAHEPWMSGRFSPAHYYHIFGYFIGIEPFSLIAPFVAIGIIISIFMSENISFIIWFLIYILGYTFFRLPNFHWYYSPTVFLIYFFALIGASKFCQYIFASSNGILKYSQISLIVIFISLFSMNLLQDTILQIRLDPFGRKALEGNIRRQAGIWLRDNAQPSQVVAAKEVGMVTYYSDANVVDLLGLVTPEAVPYVREQRYAEFFNILQPDYVFITNAPWDVLAKPIQELPSFAQDYEKVLSKRFHQEGVGDAEYILYQRR